MNYWRYLILRVEIDAIDKKDNEPPKQVAAPKVKLTWTQSKASLIELIYALQSAGAFNHANNIKVNPE